MTENSKEILTFVIALLLLVGVLILMKSADVAACARCVCGF